MISHLKQKGLVPYQECSIPTSLDPILPFRLMRIISGMLHHYWKRLVDQFSLHDIEIPQWFTHKDWNYLLFDLDEAYENLVKEFYANAIVKGEDSSAGLGENFFSLSCIFGIDTSHQLADA